MTLFRLDSSIRTEISVSRELADPLERADTDHAAVIPTPLDNFDLLQHLGTWIDVTIADARFAFGTSPLTGRPVTFARVSGCGAGTPREGSDHAALYRVRMCADVWEAEAKVLKAELIPPAEAFEAQAHRRAAEVRRAHARRLRSVAWTPIARPLGVMPRTHRHPHIGPRTESEPVTSFTSPRSTHMSTHVPPDRQMPSLSARILAEVAR